MQKLRRADHHIGDLKALLADWGKIGNGYRVFQETNSKGITTHFAQVVKPVPEEVSLLIGDASQCLLNTLDHLAFAIGSKHPDGLTEKEQEDSAFPILKAAPTPNKAGNIPLDKRTVKWPSTALKVLEGMQPYLCPTGFQNHPLWLLRDLANRDKHRSITVTVLGHSINEMSIGNGFIDYWQSFDAREIGAEPVPLLAYGRRNNADLQFRASFGIRFAKGPLVAGRGVISTLEELRQFIEDVSIRKLSSFT